jgi:hypothetical protein
MSEHNSEEILYIQTSIWVILIVWQVITNDLEEHTASSSRQKCHFHPEDEGRLFFWNTGINLLDKVS